MAVNSVNSSTATDAPSVRANALPQQAKGSVSTKEPAQPARAAPGGGSSGTAAPRPVVNTQGQMTGRIVNTRA